MPTRLASPADLPDIKRIRFAVRENVLSDPSRITDADYAAMFGARGQTWVRELDGEIVAFGCAFHDGRIWALFVDPAHEGHGHGRALHDVMIAWLRSTGVAEAALGTGQGTRAEAFYLRHGWVPTGEVVHGDVEMRLALAPSQ